jgi:catechol 2,3-dioxygenase-like lactoylglutathione lyase family enzyme
MRGTDAMNGYTHEIRGLHHNAYRCGNSEATRRFYEDFLGLRLACAMPMSVSKTGRPIRVLHTFFELGDHSFLAFFELISEGSDGKKEFVPHDRSDFDLHIAFRVDDIQTLLGFRARALEQGLEVRGPSDHGICHSIYLRDPDGYVIELTTLADDYDARMSDEARVAHRQLARWQQQKQLQGPVSPGGRDNTASQNLEES